MGAAYYTGFPMKSTATISLTSVAGNAPEWIPAPGEYRRLMFEKRIDHPDINPQYSPENPYAPGTAPWHGTGGTRGLPPYSGFVFSRWLGPHGGVVLHGGGHGNSGDNNVYGAALDAAPKLRRFTKTFENDPGWLAYVAERGNPASPIYHANVQQRAGYYTSADMEFARANGFDQLWADHGGRIPVSVHTYDSMCVIGPDIGGGPLGSLVRIGSMAQFGSASWPSYPGGSGKGVHVCDLATGRWERYTDTPAEDMSAQICSWLDPVRRRIWVLLNAPVYKMNYIDVDTRKWGSVPLPQSFSRGRESSCRYHPLMDAGIHGKGFFSSTGGGPLELWAYREGDAWLKLKASGDIPVLSNWNSASIGLCVHRGDIYAFHGKSAWRALMPADPWGGEWVWESFQIRKAADEPIEWGLGDSGVYSSVESLDNLGIMVACRWDSGGPSPSENWSRSGVAHDMGIQVFNPGQVRSGRLERSCIQISVLLNRSDVREFLEREVFDHAP